jgi:hypothetical protein
MQSELPVAGLSPDDPAVKVPSGMAQRRHDHHQDGGDPGPGKLDN